MQPLNPSQAAAGTADLGPHNLPPVPPSIILRGIDLDGRRHVVSTSGAEWMAIESGDGGDRVVIEVDRIANGQEHGVSLSDRAFHLVRLYLAHRLGRRAPMTVRNDAATFRRLRSLADRHSRRRLAAADGVREMNFKFSMRSGARAQRNEARRRCRRAS